MKKMPQKRTIASDASSSQTLRNKSSFHLRPTKKPQLRNYVNRSYALVRSVQYEKFLEVLGVDANIVKVVAELKPIVVLTKDGDTYCLTTNYPGQVFPRQLKFPTGEEVTRKLKDGKKVRCMFEIYENKIIERQNIDGKELFIKRKFTENELLVTMEYNGITSQRYYKSIPSKHSIGTETSRRQSFIYKDFDYPVTATPPVESVIEEILDSESEISDLCE